MSFRGFPSAKANAPSPLTLSLLITNPRLLYSPSSSLLKAVFRNSRPELSNMRYRREPNLEISPQQEPAETADEMGGPYRTPSPARESYISSSK